MLATLALKSQFHNHWDPIYAAQTGP